MVKGFVQSVRNAGRMVFSANTVEREKEWSWNMVTTDAQGGNSRPLAGLPWGPVCVN